MCVCAQIQYYKTPNLWLLITLMTLIFCSRAEGRAGMLSESVFSSYLMHVNYYDDSNRKFNVEWRSITQKCQAVFIISDLFYFRFFCASFRNESFSKPTIIHSKNYHFIISFLQRPKPPLKEYRKVIFKAIKSSNLSTPWRYSSCRYYWHFAQVLAAIRYPTRHALSRHVTAGLGKPFTISREKKADI